MRNEREVTYAEAIQAMRDERFLMSLAQTGFPSPSGIHPSVLSMLREENLNTPIPKNAMINEVLWAVETIHKKKQYESMSDKKKAELLKQMAVGNIKA